MATGYSNRAIGQAGEFAVCAQLGKMGLIAAPFAGNVPIYDILVTDEQLRTVPIQVKTTLGNSTWMMGDARQYMHIAFEAQSGVQTVGEMVDHAHPSLIVIYAWLSKTPAHSDRYFIMTRADVNRIAREAYSNWMAKHNGVRPRKPESYHLALGIVDFHDWENRWDLITSQLKAREYLREPAGHH